MIPVFIKCRKCLNSCCCDMPDGQVFEFEDDMYSCADCGGDLEISHIHQDLEWEENSKPKGFNIVDLMRVVRN